MLQDIILFFAGIVVGSMNAVAGGGMLLGFPILLAIGLPALAANATANVIVFPGQIAAVYGYRKYLRQVPRSYLLLLIPTIIGSAIGALILRHTSYSKFQHLVPSLIAFAVVLFALQPYVHFHFHRHMKRKVTAGHPPLWLAALLIPMAIYGGYFGAGLGFVMLAFLGFTNLRDIHKMNALKCFVLAVIPVVSICCLYSTHLIAWRSGLVMGAGTFIGGYAGSVLAQKVSSHAIRIVAIVIGIGTVCYLLIHTY
jgi:uncharacterized membrane protein YfcA